MIGNDVVDLELAAVESNWRRKGFLRKVFSKEEQKVITASDKAEIMVWLLWSMKEAAYKAHQREFQTPRRLNWLTQQCRLEDLSGSRASGEVLINGNSYFTTSEITTDYIYTSAEKELNRGVKNVILEAPSSEVKKLLLNQISGKFGVDLEQLQLKKDPLGMPFLTNQKGFSFDRFSLTGHGRFSGLILSLINCETMVKQS